MCCQAALPQIPAINHWSLTVLVCKIIDIKRWRHKMALEWAVHGLEDAEGKHAICCLPNATP